MRFDEHGNYVPGTGGWVPSARVPGVFSESTRPFLPIGSESSEPEEMSVQPVSWPELWTREEGDSWVLEPLIATGAQTVLYSAPKMGKSLLALEIAAKLARGTGYLLGQPLTTPKRVMYVDHENRLVADTRARLQKMGFTPPDLENLYMYSFPRMPKLDTTMGGLKLLELAQRHQVDLVIVDTASRTIQGEENSNDTWVQWYSNTGVLLKHAGIALLRLDHTGKDEERGQRGGSAKSGDVDMIWHMTCTVPDRVFMLKCDASRMQNEERLITIKREEDPLRHEVDALGLLGALQARSASLLCLLDEYQAPKDIGVVEASNYLRSRGVAVPNGAITKDMLKARKLGTA